MDRESLHKDGLLEQYLLGLTSREESLAVEECLKNDPQARAELEHLRRQLGVYLDDKGFDRQGSEAPATPPLNTRQDDEEVLAYLLGRNQRLNILRYALMGLCLLLIGSSVYFYRQSKSYQHALSAEKAHHVQDDNLHEAALEKIDRETVHLNGIHTVVTASEAGNLQLHHLLSDSIILLDLSHLTPPATGYAYHVHTQHGEAATPHYIIPAGEVNGLYPIEHKRVHLLVLYGPEQAFPSATAPVVVAQVDLGGPPAEPLR